MIGTKWRCISFARLASTTIFIRHFYVYLRKPGDGDMVGVSLSVVSYLLSLDTKRLCETVKVTTELEFYVAGSLEVVASRWR